MRRLLSRLLSIVAFLAGGIAAELAHPVQCLLIDAARVQVKRNKQRSGDGNH